jgi:hypothetical protein
VTLQSFAKRLATRAAAKAVLNGRIFNLAVTDASKIHQKVSKKFTNTRQIIQALVRSFPAAEIPLTVQQVEGLATLVASVAKVFGVHNKVFSRVIGVLQRQLHCIISDCL